MFDKMMETEAVRIPLASGEPRRLRFTVRSAGLTVVGESSDGSQEVLYAGAGTAKVKVITDAVALIVKPHPKVTEFQINVPEIREPLGEAVFLRDASFTDLSPRPFGQISPEIQAVMDQMNRNAIIREQAMLRALGPRQRD